MQSGNYDLKTRTQAFALKIIGMCVALPKITIAQVLGKQILRSGTSVGAHYCEARRARSKAEFISKIEGGIQELEETIYWLELMLAGSVVGADVIDPLLKEANELNAMLTASAKTAKRFNDD